MLAGVLNNTDESREDTKIVLEVTKVILHEKFEEHPQFNGTYFNDTAIIEVGLLFKYKTQIKGGARYVIPLIVENTFLFLEKHLTSGTELIPIGWKIFPNESL